MAYLKNAGPGSRPAGAPDAGQVLCALLSLPLLLPREQLPYPVLHCAQTRTSRSEPSTSPSVRVGALASFSRAWEGRSAALTRLTSSPLHAGRAIRNARDWASIILLDERYTQPAKKAQLPRWLGDDVQSPATFGALIQGVAQFSRARRAAQAKETAQ